MGNYLIQKELDELNAVSGLTKNDIWHLDRHVSTFVIVSFNFLECVQSKITGCKRNGIPAHHMDLDDFRLFDEKHWDDFTNPTDVFQVNKVKKMLDEKGAWYRNSTPEYIQAQITKSRIEKPRSELDKETRVKKKIDDVVAENSEMFLLPLKDILKIDEFKQKSEKDPMYGPCWLYELRNCFELVGEVALSTEYDVLEKLGKEHNSGSTYVLNGVDHELEIFGFRMNLSKWAEHLVDVEDWEAKELQKQLAHENAENLTQMKLEEKQNHMKARFNLQ